jgi:hypothetical protein
MQYTSDSYLPTSLIYRKEGCREVDRSYQWSLREVEGGRGR